MDTVSENALASDDDGTGEVLLVTGATGYVGGRLIPELLTRRPDARIRALVRQPGKLDGRPFAGHPRLDEVVGDATQEQAMRLALRGVRVAWYLIHSMNAGADFHERDMAAAATFARAAHAEGVERIIYLSGLGREDDDLSEHLLSRHETGDALRSAGVPVTELRAAIVVGSGSASFEIIRDLASKLPVMVTPRWVDTRCEPIAIRDLIRYLIDVLDEPRTVGETLEIGSGEQLTYADMMRICGAELGREPRIFTVPVLTPSLSSYWLHLVTSVDIGLARPLIEGLRNDVVVNDPRAAEWMPFERSSYRLAVQRALAKEDEHAGRESRWTDARRVDPVAAHEGVRPARVRIAPERDEWRDYRTFDTSLTPDELFCRVQGIGGANGYGRSVDALWQLRGLLDRVIGGTGLRRGRPPGDSLHVGDAVDFWRVERIDPPRQLRLVAEMRVPGIARLDFRIEPLPDTGGSRLHQLATLSNDTALSGLYWLSIQPLHDWVFAELGRHVVGNSSN